MSEPLSKQVIIFNGPPGVGKDTAATAVLGYVSQHASWMHPRHLKMSEPLKRGAHGMYDIFEQWDHYDKAENLKAKEVPNIDFLGLSPREAYIEVFKDLERRHGAEVLGFIMRKRMLKAQGCMLFVLSDGGRIDEITPIVRLVGEKNLMLCELHAVGKTFEGDIRSYLGDELIQRHPECTVKKIPNYFGTAEEREIFRVMCQGAAKSFLKIEEKV